MTSADEPTDDPFKWLPKKEADILSAVLTILEETISDKELREDLTGMILGTVDDWGRKKLLDSPEDKPQ